MCDVSFLQAAQVAASAQAQTQNMRSTMTAANGAYVDQVTGLYERQHQLDQEGTDRMVARSVDAMREVGSVQAIFADSGMSGNSQDRVVADVQRAAASDMTTLERNRAMQRTQTNNEVVAAAATRQSRINGAPRTSIIGSGLQIAGSYLDYQNRHSDGGKPKS